MSSPPALLPHVFEHRVRANPAGIWAKYPVATDNYEAGFRSVTNQQVLNAINRMAALFDRQLGASQRFQTLAYLGPNDLRYFIVVMAAIKVGYKIFLPNPQNSMAAHVSLLAKLRCRVLVTAYEDLSSFQIIFDHYPLHRVRIPALDELIDDAETVDYPYRKTPETAQDDPILVLHTPASSGPPKPLVYTHRSILQSVAAIPSPDGAQSTSLLLMLPSFNIAGLAMSLMIAAWDACVTVYPLPSATPTTTNFVDALDDVQRDWASLPPVVATELGDDRELLHAIAHELEHLYYVGGSVPLSAGDAVSSAIRLYQIEKPVDQTVIPQIRLQMADEVVM
ncbi:hypothetical protein ASPZODRAFT_2034801 [Penicilliopsis zonata CBS 506.65]|uniref:AMP-dependent synthetase/ligase domain-containing protein n=1 Tax=Penicilliopsis zonata CBS 506.65 TaxID=1073090 RepID=A0A1L9SFK1_9EURO|nr:hypothetical protein ASPZODRAFT_2034801 [Penicilliopsis zonata CBS 506.65]OJJ46010.1 hypothetical protein ASPZODRAFT_2034801 [Penicilliopsis zonata CBS 506.65]